MKVETYECSEVASEPIEIAEEAIAIIESLELEGQRKLVRPKTDESQPARCPYREITAEEEFAYRVLCPTTTALEKYEAGPIPLRVLQIACHAKSLRMFKRLEVWHRAVPAVKDPVLVANTGEYDWSSGAKLFILARWGEELEALATSLRLACEIVKERLIQEAIEAKAAVENVSVATLVRKGHRCNVSF